MKGTYLPFIFLLTAAACEEIGPNIDFTPVDVTLTDTTYLSTDLESPSDRIVLVEDFTGVQCVNCPAAHDAITDILDENPGRVVTTAIHNYFAGPFSESLQNFEIPEAFELDDYLGPVPAWPAAFVDRADFGSGFIYTLIISNYQVYVEERLDDPTICNVYVEATYDTDSREALVGVKVVYTGTEADENHLSVMISENNNIDLQQDLGGVEDAYVHNHVLRDMLTPATGVILNAEKVPGRVFEKEFKMTIPENWKPEDLEIVAFVHRFTTGNKEVLQAAKTTLF